jgi:hypothetical protein
VSPGDFFFCVAGLRHDGHDSLPIRGAGSLALVATATRLVYPSVRPDVRGTPRAAARCTETPL